MSEPLSVNPCRTCGPVFDPAKGLCTECVKAAQGMPYVPGVHPLDQMNRAIGGTRWGEVGIHLTPDAFDTQMKVFKTGLNKPMPLARSWAPWFNERVSVKRWLSRFRRTHPDVGVHYRGMPCLNH